MAETKDEAIGYQSLLLQPQPRFMCWIVPKVNGANGFGFCINAVPNRFHRAMQRVFFGFKYMNIDDTPIR